MYFLTCFYAEVVELADALGSGPSECKLVRVQFPPSAILFHPTARTPLLHLSMEHNNRIEVLPQSVVEKIAAGEIIERPASILKELIENALDAGAEKIDITIEDAGFSFIRVADNGRGMSREDLRKSVFRHATSKIRTADDLYALTTMGFRGEALASIAAVSRLTIATSDLDSGLGYSLHCEGGETKNSVPISQARGTTVIVRDLFFNVPARKKFMKTRKAERTTLVRLIEQLAVPFPSVHLSAVFEGKQTVDFPPEQSIPLRISQIAGIQFAKDLVCCKGSREGMDAVIYVSPPHEARQRPRYQDLYANLRRVENDQVMFAVREAYAQYIKTEYKPSFFCFITIDPSRIDVNVHPAKMKIKFEDERLLFGFVFDAVRRGIAETQVGRSDVFPARAPSPLIVERQPPEMFDKHDDLRSGNEPTSVREAHFSWREGAGEEERQTFLSFSPPDQAKKALDPDDDNKIQLTDGAKIESWGLIPCYQIHEMFILAPIKNGILLIDQHAAHERILFEQALNDCRRGRSDSQQLLFPIVIELSPSEKDIVIGGKDSFYAVGFDIQDFGGNAVSVAAIPASMSDAQVEPSLREMVRYLLGEKSGQFLSESQKRFAAAFACGAAIKTGQKLSQEEMNALLNSLFGTENPYICPHGRPTIIRMSLDEMGRRFLR
jgi:DNA mismatch repair protein MutL